MNTIHTRLAEKQFLEQLACLCRKKARFDSGYNDRDIFVYKLKENKFWLGKHYANVGRHRGDGFAVDRLDCTYCVDENGHVVVSYKFGRHPILHLPRVIAFCVGLPLCVSIILSAIQDVNWQIGGLLTSLAFLVFGVRGMFFRSKKELVPQVELLHRICGRQERAGNPAQTGNTGG